MPELGLGIITYNRREALQGCLERVREYTRSPYRLVVADDGSEDDTVSWAQSQGVPVITGQRQGVVWNRNRALSYLMGWTECDPLILIEDDGWPRGPGWEQPWIEAALKWGHISYALQVPGSILRGSGTPADPFLCRIFGGICVAASRPALWAVGYLDTRFRGYGYGHVEWSYRFARLLAGRWNHPVHRPRDLACPCLPSGIDPARVGSYFNPKQARRNQRLFRQLIHEPIWRPPARDELEREILADELGRSLGLPASTVRERLDTPWPLPGLSGPTSPRRHWLLRWRPLT